MNNKIIPRNISIESWKGACMCHARSICRQTLHEKQKAWDWNAVPSIVHTLLLTRLKTLAQTPISKEGDTIYTAQQMSRKSQYHTNRSHDQPLVPMLNTLFTPLCWDAPPIFWRSTLLFWWPALCSDASPFALQLMPLLVCYNILSRQLEIYVSLKLPWNLPTTQKPSYGCCSLRKYVAARNIFTKANAANTATRQEFWRRHLTNWRNTSIINSKTW